MEGVTLIVINFDDMLLFLIGFLIYQVAKRLYKRRQNNKRIAEQRAAIEVEYRQAPPPKVVKYSDIEHNTRRFSGSG